MGETNSDCRPCSSFAGGARHPGRHVAWAALSASGRKVRISVRQQEWGSCALGSTYRGYSRRRPGDVEKAARNVVPLTLMPVRDEQGNQRRKESLLESRSWQACAARDLRQRVFAFHAARFEIGLEVEPELRAVAEV